MRVNNYFKLVIAILVSELAGVIESVFMGSAGSPQAVSGQAWYAGLVKPVLNPPVWVFGPVWTILYALMGVAAFLVWKQLGSNQPTDEIAASSATEVGTPRNDRKIKIALSVFGIQLFLNAIWSIIFFRSHSPGWALVDIVALWLAIVWTTVFFYKISRPAAYLLLPYLLWVSFASYLNYSIWMLN